MIGYKFDSYADFLQLGLITPSSNVLTLLWIQADYPSYIFEVSLLNNHTKPRYLHQKQLTINNRQSIIIKSGSVNILNISQF